jgi:cysteinyl-tRNA synthetase
LFAKSAQKFYDELQKYGSIPELSVQNIEKIILAREKARVEKNWQLADSLRDELIEAGVILQDSPQGTKWAYSLDNIFS